MSSALLSLPAGLLCHVKMCQRRYSDTAPATARTDSPWSRQIRPRPNKSGAAEPQRQIPRAAGRASFLAATNRPHARFVGEVRPGPCLPRMARRDRASTSASGRRTTGSRQRRERRRLSAGIHRTPSLPATRPHQPSSARSQTRSSNRRLPRFGLVGAVRHTLSWREGPDHFFSPSPGVGGVCSALSN